MKKIGRNDPCFCGSGRKFKKCCENQMLGGRFQAACIDDKSAYLIQKTAGLTALFQAQLAHTPVKPIAPDFNPVVAGEKMAQSSIALE